MTIVGFSPSFWSVDDGAQFFFFNIIFWIILLMGWVYGGLTMVDVLREATSFGSELHDGDCEFVLCDASSMFRGGGVGLCFVAVGLIIFLICVFFFVVEYCRFWMRNYI